MMVFLMKTIGEKVMPLTQLQSCPCQTFITFTSMFCYKLSTTSILQWNEFSGCQTRPSLSPGKSPILPIIVWMNEPSVVMLIAFKAETD